MERWTLNVYMTDALQAIAENTAVSAGYCSGGKAGKAMGRRWVDLDKPAPPEETRTAEEIIDHIKAKLKEVE